MISIPALYGEFLLGSPQWLIPVVVVGTLLTFLVIRNYVQAGVGSNRLLWVGMLLKLSAIALLAVCLLQPMRRAKRPRPQANLLPILVDTSQSMDLSIGQSRTSWRDRIDADLATESPMFASMAQKFQTRLYGFDKRLSSAGDVTQLRRGGGASRLSENLLELGVRLSDRPVAGALLLTDGNTGSVADATQDFSDLPFPVYPVLPSRPPVASDLRIIGTTVRQTNFEISPITIAARFASNGAMGGEVFARLTNVADQTVVSEQKLKLDPDKETQSVSFRFRPSDVGLQFYRVSLFREADRAAFDDVDSLLEAATTETTLVNNTRLIAVDREGGPYRVLYVAGRPNWEFKFLRRAVSADAEVELTGLLRMANKEPKFSFRDRGVSTTNPLFQGLGEDTEETAEQYDEPVMIRLGVKGAEELASGFPKTPEELFAFDALILDDLEPEFFSQDQLAMVRRFVASRGGGLLMLGGQEMFSGRSFSQSVLGELSPVYPSRSDQSAPGSHALGLTREGMLQPWMRLRESADAESRRLRAMPKFSSVNPVGELKPGAYQMATVAGSEAQLRPAVAVQRFGKGRVGAVMIADVWRWFMRREQENPDDAAQMWRQMTRWLVGEVPKRADISVATSETDEDQVEIRVRARDEAFLPMENPNVKLTVSDPSGQSVQVDAKVLASEPGTVLASYYGDLPGKYQVTAEVRSQDGSVVGVPETGWTRQIAGREFDQVGINHALLEQIAQSSGGRMIREQDLSDFSRQLESTKVPVTETWVYPLWHRGWVITLALACLCGEWGLRRLGGLA
ncbi:hypothetical protein FYK55_02770 [Roseiconus nitratireducens]|uniref:Glutamine amidotransferase domain-containing protein n=1 Tax=Roseiconus nitratireducens TaxID=2605748 RepID=A0A5M6DHY7_9BACT|nr:hypothetical protein [Roseiconus nitratireducens]KAA5545860.1 hypothetical protein FYK55_02770 [Roseiconus nitratireducens]